MNPEKITIGGQTFTEVRRSTSAHDTWTMGLIRSAGLERVHAEPGETPEDFGWRVLGTIVQSGKLYELLGAFLVPEGVNDLDWTPQLAAETGVFLGELWEEDEKAKVHRLVVALLLPFVRDGIGSFGTLPSSSVGPPAANAASEANSTSAIGEG